MRIVGGGTALLVAVGSCLLTAACSGRHTGTSSPATPVLSSSATATERPLDDEALNGLLLSSSQVNAIMGAADMKVTRRRTALSDDSATMQPRECLAVDGAGQTDVYANTGYTAVQMQTLREGGHFSHYVDQLVVLFPSAKRAASFVGIESELWPSCHDYTHKQSGSQWSAGPIAKVDGIVSLIATQQNAGNSTWACGRALTARKNVVIDVNTCSADPKDTASVIAGQIAAKVPAQ